jgi:hypothetical protein
MKMRAWYVSSLVVVAVASMAACGSSTSGPGDAGVDHSVVDGKSPVDVHSDTVMTGVDCGAPVGCFKTAGSGASETCSFVATSGACSAGYTKGSCPASGLVGCCVTYITPEGGAPEGGLSPTKSATCYYGASAAAKANTNCMSMCYEGFPLEWDDCVPQEVARCH